MKSIFVIYLLVFISSAVNAQKNGISAYFRIGYNNTPNTDSKLLPVAPGSKEYASHFYGIGGELSWKSNKNILAAEGMIYAHGAVSSQSEYSEPFIGTGFVKTGYIVYESSGIFIYPSLALGISGIAITNYNKKQDKKYNIHTTYMLTPAFDVGLNADHIIFRFHKAGSIGAFTIAARAGYRWSKKSGSWKRVENQEYNNVRIANNGIYVGIGFGIGYFTDKKLL